jgi:hypothetical protein
MLVIVGACDEELSGKTIGLADYIMAPYRCFAASGLKWVICFLNFQF